MPNLLQRYNFYNIGLGFCRIKLFTTLFETRVFATVSHFHPRLIFAGKAGSITITVKFSKGLHSGKLQPCLKILDQGPII